MAWSIADIPAQDGRVAVVTGANGGLGLATANALAGKDAHVVMAARNQDKAAVARDEILVAHPQASLEIVPLDLGSLASVEAAAKQILAAHDRIDILVNNAGLMAMPEGRTEDGFETQFGVNHLGHWALTAHLLPALLRAEAARVVSVTSTAHHTGRAVGPDNPQMRGNYRPWKAYGQSKLANYHFALGLQREFEAQGLRAQSLVAHPGLSHTNLQVHTVDEGGAGVSGRFFRWLAVRTGMPADRGALPQLRAATDPQAKGGQMYAPRFVNSGPPVRRPILRRIGLQRAIDNLWTVSERETGLALDFEVARAGT
ncbi:MAG TPA: oxidoreductase [Actinomycetes bacterium]|jgi:NAD(P)-dependent dehydrogenase (short-subunit alcohol dehydrogenase family)|nr:oxidoreductase [Actinomycetes bacterium]